MYNYSLHIDMVKSAKNIGVIFDANMTMERHVNYVTRACYMQLYYLSKIRRFLSESVAAKLACSFILSKLDYANGILIGLSDSLMHKLQLVQNNAARLVMQKRKREHVTPILKHLHWLPVRKRLIYKFRQG